VVDRGFYILAKAWALISAAVRLAFNHGDNCQIKRSHERQAGPPGSTISLITLRNAQVRRISWVRGVRPARGRCEWPPHIAASARPPLLRSWPRLSRPSTSSARSSP